jgi:hypothetical protein
MFILLLLLLLFYYLLLVSASKGQHQVNIYKKLKMMVHIIKMWKYVTESHAVRNISVSQLGHSEKAVRSGEQLLLFFHPFT